MVTEFRQLRRFPILLGMFTEKLTDMKFLKDTFDKWIEIMNVQEEYDQLKTLLLILDEETQTKFYNNLRKLMLKREQVCSDAGTQLIFQVSFIISNYRLFRLQSNMSIS